jgi:hypothetical protein
LEAIAQAVHLDLTTAGMAIAMMHEQDFHGAIACGSNVRMRRDGTRCGHRPP